MALRVGDRHKFCRERIGVMGGLADTVSRVMEMGEIPYLDTSLPVGRLDEQATRWIGPKAQEQ